MAIYRQLLYYSTLMLICICIGDGRQKINTFEIKALKPHDTAQECDVRDLKAATAKCNKYLDGILAQNLTTCHVPGNGTILEYRCVEGTWKLSTGTDFHLRSKRFWGALFGFLTAVVTLVTVVYCTEKYGNMECREEEVEVENLIPPEYTTCPPSGIKSLYTADKKQKTVQITWADPEASDDEQLMSNEQTCCDFKSGDNFPGLPGSGRTHTVTYLAKDNHGLSVTCSFKFDVKYLTCGEPITPSNGKKVSCPDGYIYGGVCTFECNTGFEMVGSDTATCQQDETWDNSPACQKVKCTAPFEITNGNVECDDTTYPFDDDCVITCDEGFQLNGPLKMTCQADKTWSVDASDVSCVDNEAPNIECQTPQIFYADRGSFETSVTWIEPTATDNVDSNPTIAHQSGPFQGQTLTEGFHLVVYKATDHDGNSYSALSECTITLEVKVIKCSTGPTDALDVSRFITYNCSDTSFYNGVSCILACDLNLPLNGTDLMMCERDGTTDKGVWSWGSGHQPFCQVVECPSLDPPTNGAFTTDSVLARPLHVMLCKKGFDISSVGSQFQGRLSCQDSGEWYPLDAFPDCIVSVLPWLNMPAELYFEGDCNDDTTVDQIKEIVLEYLSGLQADIDQSICPDVDTCKAENLVVVCGETSRRRRRSRSPHYITKRQTEFALVQWDNKIVFDQGNKTTQDKYLEILDAFDDIENKIQEDVNNGKINVSSAGLMTPSDALRIDKTQLQSLFCQPGYLLDTGSVVCKPCPPGTYLNSTTETCEYCKIGKYMDHEGALECDACPEGNSTLSSGSKDIDKCKPLCSPGYFSSSTMEPCSACPVGTYQHLQGRDTCLACPLGTATNRTSSTTVDDCDFFDISVGQMSQRTDIGSFSAGGLNRLSVSVWLKPRSTDIPDMSVYITDSVMGDVITLTASDLVYFGFGTSSAVQINTTFSSERWTHIMCTGDLASGALQIYVDGEMIVDDAGGTPDSTRTVSAGKVQILSNSKGMYISGLVVYGRHLSNNDMTSLLQTCAVASSDEIFSMADIIPNIVEGIAVIAPTTCDPIDECADEPCGNHTCINMVDDFECICQDGMSGDLCDIPPDYCQDHECVQGECVPDTGTYTCNCTDGYTGVFCDTPPVNGEWSHWGEWNGCDISCGGGTRSRTRSCANPTPGFMGQDCDGNNMETESCNEEICPVCPNLNRKFGTIVTCNDNVQENLLECNMTCITGRYLANGRTKYWCGPSTKHEWLPKDEAPDCVETTAPTFFGTQASVSYTTTIADSEEAAVLSSVEQGVSDVDCVKSGLCTVTSSVSNESRKRRSTTSTLTLQSFIELTDTGDLGITDYLANGTETSAMTELLGALGAINEFIVFIQNNTESIFQVTVGGVDYVLENNSTNIVAAVTCPSGHAGADGLCVECPAGTKLVNTACLDCEVGTYQPETGQSTCLTCPSGYTTTTYGAIDVLECSLMSDDSDDDDSDNDDDDDDDDYDGGKTNNAVVIVVAVLSSVAFICSVLAIIVVVWKTIVRRGFRRNERNGSFASLSMVRSASSMSNADTNVRTTFNSGNIKGSMTSSQLSNPQPDSGAVFQDQPPAYGSHGFEVTTQPFTPAPKPCLKSEKLDC